MQVYASSRKRYVASDSKTKLAMHYYYYYYYYYIIKPQVSPLSSDSVCLYFFIAYMLYLLYEVVKFCGAIASINFFQVPQ